MLCKVIKAERQISTSGFGEVVQLISLPEKKIGLLNTQGQLLIYDLYRVQIDKINLNSKIFQVHTYSETQIIILSHENKAAQMFNLKTRQKYHITDIPSVKIGDKFKDMTIFFQTKTKVFRQSGHICFMEYVQHQTNLIVMLKGQYTARKFSVHNTNFVIQDYDEKSKIIIYKQDIEKDKPWTFTLIDIEKEFQKVQINLDFSTILNFQQNSLVTAVKGLSEEQILLFINSQEPGLWIYNISIDSFTRIKTQIQSGLQQIILLNRQKEVLILSYLGNDENDKQVIDWIDLKQKKLLLRLKQDTGNLIAGWENNFIINQKIGDEANKKFWLKYIAKKSSLFMNLLIKKQILERFGSTMCRKAIQLLN